MRYFVFYLNDCDCDWIVGVVSSLLFGELCLSTLVFTVEFFLSLFAAHGVQLLVFLEMDTLGRM